MRAFYLVVELMKFGFGALYALCAEYIAKNVMTHKALENLDKIL